MTDGAEAAGRGALLGSWWGVGGRQMTRLCSAVSFAVFLCSALWFLVCVSVCSRLVEDEELGS